MRLLHTSDWHVGRAIRGHSRAGEHRAVLAEIAGLAAAHAVDLTVVAGDLFDTSAPTAESERIAWDALLALAEVAPVVALAGNHDGARRLDAVARLLALGRITVVTEPRPPADGGVLSLAAADGTPVLLATMPFVSQRGIVRSEALMSEPAFRNAQSYADRLAHVLAALATGFSGDAVNLVAAHLFVTGGAAGGGERGAHLVEEYAVPAAAFPVAAAYVALGHLHRPQALAGPCPIHYCGSPLQLDFGEETAAKQVNLVEAQPGIRAKVTALPLRAGRPLVSVTGTVADLEALAHEQAWSADDGDAGPWLRVEVTEPARAGLADEVRAVLGERVVEVRVARPADGAGNRQTGRRDGRTPSQLFGSYLQDRGVVDADLERAFAALYDEVHEPEEIPEAEPAPTGSAAAAAGSGSQLSLLS
ncbi:MAG: exonuclease SbcCD subunit D [Acidimicrobiia bacterium]|nr:exonuclease SbcCD subunit D [Acidimicrobiia bacterium]